MSIVISAPRILVYGGAGALGSSVISTFKQRGWDTVNVDFKSNSNATQDILLSPGKSWVDNTRIVMEHLETPEGGLQSVVNAAGGWRGGYIEGDLEEFPVMMEMCAHSAISAAHIATNRLAKTGALILTGAKPVMDNSDGMLAYGLSKCITHQLVRELARPSAYLNADPIGLVVGLLPTTIDTPANREAMPDADFSQWTSPEEISEVVYYLSSGVRLSSMKTKCFDVLEHHGKFVEV